MNQIFRENLKYILAVLLVWAITFPFVLQNKDTILADLTLRYNALFGYPNPGITRELVAKGDAILEGRKEGSSNFFLKLTSFFQSEENQKSSALPLDLHLMEKSCLYYQSKNHVEETFLELTWREKAMEWGSPLFTKVTTPGEIVLGPNPKEYWNSHIENVLEALDYYKRALRFSGPDFIVPKKIESVAWAVCRPAEILLAYKTHMMETENYVITSLAKEDKLPSNLTDVQKRSIALSIIKKGIFPEVNPNDYLESLLRQILLTGMKSFSPREMDSVFERILYFVGNSEREYLKFRFRRAELFYQLGLEDPEYYKKAIIEFNESSNIKLALEDEEANLPLLLVHQFEAVLKQAECYQKLGENKKSLQILDSLAPKLRNVDERSVGGIKREIVQSYREIKRTVLRKLSRFEEADEIPLTE
ncbi:hypothetical protein [Leptospira ilyithenensis]|uniref:Uncharacterized protein n=1 Tax=Leptospira ilyithenensis TaxID=2484901 RepID=A0A4V3JXB3_9LEPT|nr:hypothetical protein [Leptospira ilyithenensis]TGN10021.1 hypothetical protein EHS11_10685 [Leptospira ilyithenensis]